MNAYFEKGIIYYSLRNMLQYIFTENSLIILITPQKFHYQKIEMYLLQTITFPIFKLILLSLS